jgi:hypothetical protein
LSGPGKVCSLTNRAADRLRDQSAVSESVLMLKTRHLFEQNFCKRRPTNGLRHSKHTLG